MTSCTVFLTPGTIAYTFETYNRRQEEEGKSQKAKILLFPVPCSLFPLIK
jgi:hypothetical protein